MRRVSMLVMLVLLVAFVGETIAAESHFSKQLDARIGRQQSRIDQGIKKGQLTRSETQVLQDNLNWIKNEEVRLRSDGKLTPYEQKRLMKMLDDNENMIKDKRRNYKRLY